MRWSQRLGEAIRANTDRLIEEGRDMGHGEWAWSGSAGSHRLMQGRGGI